MECGSAKREAAPRPGRDNSVSSSRHNLLTASFWTPNHLEMESVHGNKYCEFKDLNRFTASVSQPYLLHRADTTSFSSPSAARPRRFNGFSAILHRFITGSWACSA